MNTKLSIIMPFCGEYPQVIFTIMSIWNQFQDYPKLDWELIAVNNWCDQAAKQADYQYTCPDCKKTHKVPRGEANTYRPPYKNPDPGGSRVKSYAAIHQWLKYVEYDSKLSHWNAKNAGVAAATGDILFFIDAHCALPPDSLADMYGEYILNHDKLNGTLHLPICYFLERVGKALIYKLVAVPEKAYYHY
jgi:glycosyltransferase involved in cell wall biosynthesis